MTSVFYIVSKNQIRETPQKRHHKFIEYYDVRHAEAALRSLNGCDIAGKRIKLEPSRPGGSRKKCVLHISHIPVSGIELEKFASECLAF